MCSWLTTSWPPRSIWLQPAARARPVRAWKREKAECRAAIPLVYARRLPFKPPAEWPLSHCEGRTLVRPRALRLELRRQRQQRRFFVRAADQLDGERQSVIGEAGRDRCGGLSGHIPRDRE